MFRSMELFERIMGVEHELHGALFGSNRLSPRGRCQSSSPPSSPLGTWPWEVSPPCPQQSMAPVTICAVVMGRGHLWLFGDEDFRGQQQPNHTGRILQRSATHLGGIEHAS